MPIPNIPILDQAVQRPDLMRSIVAVDCTPELAEKWLVHNTHNRTLKRDSIDRFVSDMETGEWQWTGEPIRFADDGTLIDGQNRLYAIVESGATVPVLVIGDLPMGAQRDIDTGTSRKLTDVLKLNGEPQSSSLAALLHRTEAWSRGARRSVGSTGRTSISQCLRFLDGHPELRELLTPSRAVADHCDLPASVVGTMWWVFDQIDTDDAEYFFRRLGDGQGLIKGDAIYELRRTAKAINESVRGERSQTFLTAITIKAWNAYRDGTAVSLFTWRPGGAKPEKFPEPR